MSFPPGGSGNYRDDTKLRTQHRAGLNRGTRLMAKKSSFPEELKRPKRKMRLSYKER